MTSRSVPSRLLLGAMVAALAFVSFAPAASAAERSGPDARGDVPYARGDITRIRIIHRSANVDLRVRTRVGGQPVNNWPNRATYIRWRISTDADPAPEYFADLRLRRGVDTVFVGRLRNANDNTLVAGCGANQYANTPTARVTAVGNEYRYQFLRGCIGAPVRVRAQARFRWDNGNANVGPVHVDRAPNARYTGPVVSG